jgi:hypothetical protein
MFSTPSTNSIIFSLSLYLFLSLPHSSSRLFVVVYFDHSLLYLYSPLHLKTLVLDLSRDTTTDDHFATVEDFSRLSCVYKRQQQSAIFFLFLTLLISCFFLLRLTSHLTLTYRWSIVYNQ